MSCWAQKRKHLIGLIFIILTKYCSVAAGEMHGMGDLVITGTPLLIQTLVPDCFSLYEASQTGRQAGSQALHPD